MEKGHLSNKEIFTIGLMLFALFLGAGNMIFPPFLGQEAGTNVWIAILGFLVTGVGLPLLGVIAIAKSGDLQTLASRVHPIYGVIFTVIMYLAIGPLFGIPRTGTVSFEISVSPFLPESVSSSNLPLFIYTIVFFGLTAWLSMNPTKLVDRIGKVLTPALLIILTILVVKSLVTPMGTPSEAKGPYVDGPFFKGFIEGYLTLDTIAALVFGIVVINALKDRGVTSKAIMTKACVYAGMIAATGLALVYLSLAYIGSTAPSAIGVKENGGAILAGASSFLFGSSGAIILGLAITFACITTSVGLVSSCAQYFSKLFKNVSYKTFVIVLSVFSMVIANFGLTQLIAFSLPILIIIYPLAIVLISLSFFHNKFNGYSFVYIGALVPTGLLSLVDGLKIAGLNVNSLVEFLSFLPLFSQGIGWIVPAIVGAILGYILANLVGESKKKVTTN
ncbi:branched-chain amino acid transport system II carrier protein [Bacillus sp. 31A1R]|uniref:Branched-chain amino acid transport system carrier protein n=1 Tax=Robertmurraya mangrovi TaxID=3098077 RepID=A0ABU5IZD2_9BACI|nr:branched-chain amino acid transport system II carrier protein [Bacillus sp. 31A1R]MDZ5472529.1 branched-chain amino acid transport system II carrier protein [Bacillus sp. 31A1R]